MENILVIGAAGQIGSELVVELRKRYGTQRVFATDIKQASEDIVNGGPFEILDVMDGNRLIHFVIRHKITQIYHLAAVLSGNAEKIPVQAWDINMRSLMNILDLAKEVDAIKKVFWPSSIAVFGPSTPRFDTPQYTITEPNTVYGISKLAGERWVEYFHKRYGVDVRSIRYPGLISYKTEAGGGTTDYAVEIFYDAVKKGSYTSFLSKETKLPMMFMEDAIKATIDLMEADKEKLSLHSSYNVAGISFNPQELAEEIKKHIPNFKIDYEPDFRQAIANSWPATIDDSVAKADWGLEYKYNLPELTQSMLDGVKKKLGEIE
ncbi:MAG: NAD-dependent epimerase/dehydratase family protein [Bacteroidales bacterium]|nr:NAD-dependent epimerase/dehydratase family protein [Bacteroidales bacterium]